MVSESRGSYPDAAKENRYKTVDTLAEVEAKKPEAKCGRQQWQLAMELKVQARNQRIMVITEARANHTCRFVLKYQPLSPVAWNVIKITFFSSSVSRGMGSEERKITCQEPV